MRGSVAVSSIVISAEDAMPRIFARGLMLAGVVAGLALGGAAQAQTVSATVVGRIGADAGRDTFGLFGRKGEDLAGRVLAITYTLDASAMAPAGPATDSASAWQGGTGSVLMKIGSRTVSLPMDHDGGVPETRVLLHSDGRGDWAAYQFALSGPNGAKATVGVSLLSPKHPFAAGKPLAEPLSYSPSHSERRGQLLSFDLTSGGAREHVTADIVSISYGP
jgi:hypothetical protein